MIKSSKDLIKDALKIFEKKSRKKRFTVVNSGFKKLDLYTGGWQPGELIVIGSRPGMGKLAFVTSMIKNIAVDFEQEVALFTLEMSAHNHITRMIATETGIELLKLELGKLEANDWQKLNVKLEKISNAPIYIDDTPSLSIAELSIKASKLVLEKNVKVIVVNYLQLMTIEMASLTIRRQEIDAITRKLKELALELDVPIIVMSQLPSTIETRIGTKRPLLTDLSVNGEIAQNADVVCFIYRPEYYGFEEWDDYECTPCKEQAEIIIAKHSNCDIKNIRVKFSGNTGKFSDLE